MAPRGVGVTRAAIAGWGVALPAGRLTNADLEQRVDTTDEWIVGRTGIRERRVAGDGESTATLAAEAGAAAIKKAGISPADVDLLVVATASPEQPIPHTGAFVGERIGLRCGSFDLNAGCAGFVYELVVGAGMLSHGYRNILLVGAETLSRITDYSDRGTCVLFGDGAGSVVLQPATGDEGLLAMDLGCDGSAAGLLEIPAGGSRRPTSAATVAAGEHFLKMQGNEVFKRAVRATVETAERALARAGLTAADIDWFVPHQANLRIITAATQRLGIPDDRTIVNLDRYGNTSAASIPIALVEAVDDGRIADGDVVLLAGFGAGMAWASAVVRWGRPAA
jgi:3-oxoacyl-[acyl-carrier-protein] synthase-3